MTTIQLAMEAGETSPWVLINAANLWLRAGADQALAESEARNLLQHSVKAKATFKMLTSFKETRQLLDADLQLKQRLEDAARNNSQSLPPLQHFADLTQGI